MNNTKNIPLSVPVTCGNEWKYVKECLDTGWVSSIGGFVDKFEQDISRYLRSRFAIACSSGTSALHISLILAGVGAGDEVIVPTITFIAPVNAVRYVGGRPVFMDCDDYLNIDVDKLEEFCQNECDFVNGKLINKRSKARIKAIIPVHVFGNPVNVERIMGISSRFNLKVIEDAAESLGSYYKRGEYKGKMTGSVGYVGCLSFNGNKIITTGGGGMIVTNIEKHYEKAKYLTTQAKDDPRFYIHNEIGYNYRMTNLQAALGCAQLEQITKFLKIKRKNYEIYRKYIDQIDGLTLIGEPEYGFSNFWLYTLVIDKEKYGLSRDELMNKLLVNNIESRPLWLSNHLQKPYAGFQNYKIEKANTISKKILNIPSSITLSNDDIYEVVKILKMSNQRLLI